MKISSFLFRFRGWILFLIVLIGFWAPLDRAGGARPASTWLFLSGTLARHNILPVSYASIAVMGAAILLAVLGALLRSWAAAYLGNSIVRDRQLHAERVVADGPYRYVRNPLYLGFWLHMWALAILMPPGGAVFALAAVTIFLGVLSHTEERHLRAERGEEYAAYAQRVPRFFCALRSRIPAGTIQPDWKKGFASEIYMWGVAITYIAFASRYDATILVQGILISLGVAILARGAMRPAIPEAQ